MNINDVFYLVIGSLLLFFCFAELRLSGRYKGQLREWVQIKLALRDYKECLSSGTKPLTKRIIQQYFVYEENIEGLTLSKKGELFLVNQPVSSFVPHQPTSPYRFVPALLTTIGVLGTFLGISLGLSDFHTTSGGSQALMNSATNLLEGMKTAFYTSLSGLSASIVFMIAHAFLAKKREKNHRRLVDELSELCLAISPVSLLSKLNSDENSLLIEKQLKAAESSIASNASLVEVTSGLASVFSNFNTDELSRSLSDAVKESMHESFAPAVDRISDSLRQLKDIKEQNSKEIIELMISSFKEEIVEPMLTDAKVVNNAILRSVDSNKKLAVKQLEVAETSIASNTGLSEVTTDLAKVFSSFNAEELSRSLSIAVKESMHESFSPAVDRISDSLSQIKDIKEQNSKEIIDLMTSTFKEDIVEPMLSHSKATNEAILKSVDSNEKLAEKMETMVESLDSTLSTLNKFQEETLSKLEKFAKDLAEILLDFKNDTASVLDSIGSEIHLAVDASVKSMERQREAFEESTEKASQAFSEQNAVLASIGTASSELMNDARQNLLEGLSNIDEKVKSMSAVVQSELEIFRLAYQENLKSFFEQQANLLESTLGEQREGLSAVIADYRLAFSEESQLRAKQYTAIDEQYKNLQTGVSLVQELVEAVGMNKASSFNQLEDVAKALSSQVGRLRHAFEEAAERFNKVSEQLPEAMSDYFIYARENSEKYFGEFDEAAARVHSKLADAANLLVTSMQQIDMQMKSSEQARVAK